MQCHEIGAILPVEVGELEKITKERIVRVCWGYHVVDGAHPTAWGTGVDTTVVVTNSGKLFSLTKRVDSLLIPKREEPKKPTETKEPESKYKLK
jgi:hypothetical protein